MFRIDSFTVDGKEGFSYTDSLMPVFRFSFATSHNADEIAQATLKVSNGYEKELHGFSFRYDGPALRPFVRYDALLESENTHGEKAKSEVSFSLGRCSLPWVGRYLSSENPKARGILFERTIPYHKKIKSAVLYLSYFGKGSLSLNGKPLYHFFENARNLYTILDLSDEMEEKENKLSFLLLRKEASPFLLYELHLVYQDDTFEIIKSDEKTALSLSLPYTREKKTDIITFDSAFAEDSLTFHPSQMVSVPKNLLLSDSLIMKEESVMAAREVKESQDRLILSFGHQHFGYPSFILQAQKEEDIRIDYLDKNRPIRSLIYKAKQGENRFTDAFGLGVYDSLSFSSCKKEELNLVFHKVSPYTSSYLEFSGEDKEQKEKTEEALLPLLKPLPSLFWEENLSLSAQRSLYETLLLLYPVKRELYNEAEMLLENDSLAVFPLVSVLFKKEPDNKRLKDFYPRLKALLSHKEKKLLHPLSHQKRVKGEEILSLIYRNMADYASLVSLEDEAEYQKKRDSLKAKLSKENDLPAKEKLADLSPADRKALLSHVLSLLNSQGLSEDVYQSPAYFRELFFAANPKEKKRLQESLLTYDFTSPLLCSLYTLERDFGLYRENDTAYLLYLPFFARGKNHSFTLKREEGTLAIAYHDQEKRRSLDLIIPPSFTLVLFSEDGVQKRLKMGSYHLKLDAESHFTLTDKIC